MARSYRAARRTARALSKVVNRHGAAAYRAGSGTRGFVRNASRAIRASVKASTVRTRYEGRMMRRPTAERSAPSRMWYKRGGRAVKGMSVPNYNVRRNLRPRRRRA